MGSMASENPGGPGPGGGGMESETCTTPFIFRNLLQSSSVTSTTVNIGPTGASVFGNIYGFTGVGNTKFSIENNLGLYKSSNDFLRFGFDQVTSSSEPLVYWNSTENFALSFGYGGEISSINRILTLQNDNKVGINISSPEAALHVKSYLPSPNEGSTGQIQGLLIENNGYRNHDFALEIRTGQLPEGVAMSNGRVFTVSNAGTVHIGEGLNWSTPGDAAMRYRLYVQGGIRAEKVRVDVASENDWADYVFEEEYEMLSTEDLEDFIKTNKHLPGVPSAAQVVEEGVDLAEMNKILLEKVEELTLRVIELEKQSQFEALIDRLVGKWNLDSVFEGGKREPSIPNIASDKDWLVLHQDFTFSYFHAGEEYSGNWTSEKDVLTLKDIEGKVIFRYKVSFKGNSLILGSRIRHESRGPGSYYFFSK